MRQCIPRLLPICWHGWCICWRERSLVGPIYKDSCPLKNEVPLLKLLLAIIRTAVTVPPFFSGWLTVTVFVLSDMFLGCNPRQETGIGTVSLLSVKNPHRRVRASVGIFKGFSEDVKFLLGGGGSVIPILLVEPCGVSGVWSRWSSVVWGLMLCGDCVLWADRQ